MQRLPQLSQISLAVAVAALSSGMAAADNSALTNEHYIQGNLVIDWNSRLPDNQEKGYPKLGVSDVYALDATVGFTFYKGKITCLPYVFSKLIGRVLQEGTCQYDLDVGVINPKDTSQRKAVGKWVGTRPLDTEGRSDLSSANLRIEVQTAGQAKGFISPFSGVITASPVKAKTTLSNLVAAAKQKTATLTRMVSGKTVSVTLGKVDPVIFENVGLAMGPSANYPEATVNGQFVYSYETNNWFPALELAHNGIKDRISGGLKWVDDSEKKTGHYELNILFNETHSSSENSAFAEAQGEDAFFAAEPNQSIVNGTIGFTDTRMEGVDAPIKSTISYNLGLQKVTAEQAQIVWKILLLMPTQLYGE